MLSLQVREFPAFRGVIGKLVVWKFGSPNNVSSHTKTSLVKSA